MLAQAAGEVEATRKEGLKARLMVPLMRGHDGAALQFEVKLANLDQLDQFRSRGVGSPRQLSKQICPLQQRTRNVAHWPEVLWAISCL